MVFLQQSVASNPEPGSPAKWMNSREGEAGAAPLSYSTITELPEKMLTVVVQPATELIHAQTVTTLRT